MSVGTIADLEQILAAEYGKQGKISRLEGENENFLLLEPSGSRFVLKLCGEEQDDSILELENLAVEAVASAGLGLELPRIIRTRRGGIEARHEMGGRELRGWLLQFVEGTPWCQAGPASEDRRKDLGRTLGKLSRVLASLEHPAARRTHKWDLTASEKYRGRVALIQQPERRRILERAFFLFTAAAGPALSLLPRGLIHGDLNDENVLISGDRVCGLLDFGDCLDNPIICDLAIALAYVLLEEADPLSAGAEIVAGYHQERPLAPRELEVLFPLICGRLAVSLTTAAHRKTVDPGRSAWFVTEERAWQALERYVRLDPLTAADRLAHATGVAPFPERTTDPERTRERRQKHFSAALSLSYEEPLKLSHGRAQFLYDHQERPYLDLYNNVCHVGHCHPRVAEVACRQMKRLNTNTRYLYDQLVDYAERLSSLLPPRLDCCFFVNSGSEANELAIRLARAHTERQDILVVDNAYHGHTSTMIDLSPYKFMGPGGTLEPCDWVHVVPVPDGYRGIVKGQGRKAGEAYAERVGAVLESVQRPVAAFIAESILSCGGQIVPPEGYLECVFRQVRGAGGVCIIDEVQVGFGRVGTHFWGFELQGVVPDIVVLGKPIGNGHPMGAVVATREIADSFAATGMEFFATFGGNPVSCAVGMAVLDVIEEEGLQENAAEVGAHLLNGLRELQLKHELIGDVRGLGLFMGIELVRDRKTLEPAGHEAARVVNELRRNGILTGTDGPFHNVLKIKPPLVITREDADMVVRVLDDILSEVEGD